MSITESTQPEQQQQQQQQYAPRPSLRQQVRDHMHGHWLAATALTLLTLILLTNLWHLHQTRVEDGLVKRSSCLSARYDFGTDKLQTYQQMNPYERGIADAYDCAVPGR